MAEGLTLYKLIILYMLRKVTFPLSNTQLTDYFISQEITDYFHAQEAIHDLEDSGLISCEKIRNTSLYKATMNGEKTLEYFVGDIPPAIKKDTDDYLRTKSYELRNESTTLADYEKNEDGTYAVHCVVSEGKDRIIDLTINVTTEEEADRVCTKWPEKAQDIYMHVMNTLL